VPTHQFGFRNNNSTIDQVHRIAEIIERTFENKGVWCTVFLDIAQAFDRVWQRGLLHKLRSILPHHFHHVLKRYLTNRHENSQTELKLIKAGVPQGSVLGPVLYLLYINDMPTTCNSPMTKFADDTAVTAVGDTVANSTRKLQSAVKECWYLEKIANKTQRIQIGTYGL
jgi:hypothetical protein